MAKGSAHGSAGPAQSGASSSGSGAGAARARPMGRKRAWIASAVWMLATIAVLIRLPPSHQDSAGALPASDIVAPRAIVVVDDEATAAERERIQRFHPRIWRYDASVKDSAAASIESLFVALRERVPASAADLEEIAGRVQRDSGVLLRPRDLEFLYREANLDRLRQNLLLIVERTLEGRAIVSNKALFAAHYADFAGTPSLHFENAPGSAIERRLRAGEALGWPEDARRYLTEIELRAFHPSGQDRPLVDVAVQILDQTLGPNLVYNPVATRDRLARLLLDLEQNPVRKSFARGEVIARAGEPLTSTQAEASRVVNQIHWRAFPLNALGVTCFALLCAGATAFYLGRVRQEVAFSASNVTLVFAPLLLVLMTGRVVHHLELAPPEVLDTLFPSALVGLLATIMISPQVGFVLVLIAGILFGATTGQDLSFHAVALFGGFTAVISLRSIRTRLDVMVAGLRVGMVNVVVLGVLGLLRVPVEIDSRAMALGMINGLFCGAATLPIVAVFERAFGLVTDIRLLEITGPQHPLIRMLEERAPGTYQHVLNVTKLAESAAEAVGANYLLTRSGAYFHDIGKMLKPKYFTENQVTLDDKKAHSRLSPYMSVLIIKNHVKEGIELARKYKLPQKVIDFIPQHHGTSLIRYFYNEAMQRYEDSASTSAVREDEFRYAGPKPQSAEAGIVLLADSVEAIVTSVFTGSKVNENDLRRTVEKAVQDRFNDGQFDECDLTLKDLHAIRESFVKTLKARFHQRIAYPAPPKKEPVRPADPREPRVARPEPRPEQAVANAATAVTVVARPETPVQAPAAGA